jgi:transposase, IS30 family
MESKKYKRLTLKERTIIEVLLKQNYTRTAIAKCIKRPRSTVTRELQKWIRLPCNTYDASLAHWYSEEEQKSKHSKTKIELDKRLRHYIFRGLLNGLSPELISGRIKVDYPENFQMRISHESIYIYIYTHPQGKLNRKLISLLVRKKRRRNSNKLSNRKKIRIKDQLSIDQRPVYIEDRIEVGHWEGDLIIGSKQASAIGTMVERKTRYTIIAKIANRKSDVVVTAFVDNLKLLQSSLLKTFTYDNGMEMANHKDFTQRTRMPVYFAHPYSSWERGTNENTNGLIRRFFPKGTDFNQISNEQLKKVENILNNRPRKVLGYLTPKEALELEVNTESGNNFLTYKSQKSYSR